MAGSSSVRTPKEHIEEIRRTKYSIGGEPNPLRKDLHQAVKNLSAELYAKDVQFLMELIQNAEDNKYEEGIKPSLEFLITSKDITATGASATLLIFNNERGFLPEHIDSICSVGLSTKKGDYKRGYIGEKGIGFKSVFLITAQPYIFSNGYQIRFSEIPCSQCNIGYIVPEWVEDNPSLSIINDVYSSGKNLPTTTFVLPLKPDKVKPVTHQLSSIRPEVLLFLSKIKQLSVREDNEDPKRSIVTAVSISSETNFVTRKNIDAESYLLHLSAGEKGGFEECSYHIWRQRFPVKEECRVERRTEVDVMLAFPNGEPLNRGTSSPGIYAFLPTEMLTNFPFVIQADFVLASSRETIRLDNAWNQEILNCVPSAFVNAFISLVKSVEDAPVSALPRMFSFLPVNTSAYANLNSVRSCIQEKLKDENIIPCESYSEQKIFQKPCEVGRLMPAFWDLLEKGKKQGVSLCNISTHGKYILSSAFDKEQYNNIFQFLGVKYVDDEWYVKCIRSSNFVSGVSEDLYSDLLLFLAENWSSSFAKTSIVNIPILKYVGVDGIVSLCSINDSLSHPSMLLLSNEFCHMSWLIDWNKEFRCAGNHFFLPKSMQDLLRSHGKGRTILDWLVNKVKVSSVSVYDFACLLSKALNNDRKFVVAFVHFLYHSSAKSFLSNKEIHHLCGLTPLVDNYGQVTTSRRGILVPAKGSRWLQLIGSNPWRSGGFIELGEDYLHSSRHAGLHSSEKELVGFLKVHLQALDIPDISPPDAPLPSVNSLLTKQNAFLLLDWVKSLQSKRINIPTRFLTSIKEGSWIKVSLGGSAGCKPPSQSFLLASSWADVLQNGSVLVDIPLIDQKYYADKINNYEEELRKFGVKFDFGEACQYIGNHLISLSDSSMLTRGHVLSMLKFIKFLRERFLPLDNLINSIQGKRWLRTSQGYQRPEKSVFFSEEWRAASQISDIPFLDQDYYGENILSYKTELQLIGVVFGMKDCYQLVIDNFKHSAALTSITAEALFLILECIRYSRLSRDFLVAVKRKACIKTNMGFKSPAECYLPDPEWGFLLQIFSNFPLIDENFYGPSIFSFKNVLKEIGVLVDFKEATTAFAIVFRKQASLLSINEDNVLLLLLCCKKLNGTSFPLPPDLKSCIAEVKWLRTRLGDYRSPKQCILFDTDWESISSIAVLPFIDDSDNYYGKKIHEYKEELQNFGVVVAFSDGASLVTAGLRLPDYPGSMKPAVAYSLLECLKSLQQQQNEALLAAFISKTDKKWIKTTAGYRSPKECLLFSSDWQFILWQEDGPFIDENFYGSDITAYKKQLVELGVVVDIKNGCQLVADFLDFHTDFDTITRIYEYLNRFNWKPSSEGSKRIWIPCGGKNGEWVSPEKCVLHDRLDLFTCQLNVLEKHYQKDILSFFSGVFEVKANPSLDDYCKLWKTWEDSDCKVSEVHCCAFWGFVVKQWSKNTKGILFEKLSKVPVYSGSNEISLFDKHDVFIADDLYLRDLFEHYSSRPLFVWYPQPSSQHVPRDKLLEIYSNIGVRSLSESVQKELSTIDGLQHKQVDPKEMFIGRGLFKLILGFLANPTLQLEAEKRHEAVRCLLNITVLETTQQINVCYSLSLSSGEVLNVEADRMIRWDRQNSRFFSRKLDKSGSHKNVLEYATYFAEVVSEGLLWEKEDHVHQLAELLRIGFIMDFDEAAIDFLMKSKNLEIHLEDEEFLSSALSSDE